MAYCPICKEPMLSERPHAHAKRRTAGVEPTDPEVWNLVFADMRSRVQVGMDRYGKPLTVHNDRDALVDAYEEALDLVVYLRQELHRRDGK